MNEMKRPLPESYWVLPGRFLAGEYPMSNSEERTRRQMDAFLENGFDTFIDLTNPNELPPYLPILTEQAQAYEKEIRYRRFPIGDFGIPTRETMQSILDEIDASLESNHRLYLHCWGGVGRTGTTVGCYLVRHGHSGRDALQQLAAWWRYVPKSIFHPRSPETNTQVDFILNWQEPKK
ncbi:MAG: dual specificity protein phosphatase family protein [Chloroflexi bacterium]|nr:dual specificity protein phosphatase family protein [Chloroflexota bacterium]